MHISRYLKKYPCLDNPDRVLLFSTRTLAKVLVPTSVLKSMEEGSLSPQNQATLTRLGFLVPDAEQERLRMLSALDIADSKATTAYIMAVMSLDCNLACTYCYEGGQRGSHYMSAETADQLVRFVEKEFLQSGAKDIVLEFYGGEPLLSFDLIREISRRLKASVENAARKYCFTLVTNGTLLTADVVRELIPLGLERARVTLDGPPENHNLYRPFVSGAGSFEVIIENLRDVSGLIKVGVSGNYTRENYREFPRLLDIFADKELTPDKISHVMFAPITETLGEHLVPEFSEGCVSADEPWLVEASLYLREEILRRGYFTPKVAPTVCMIESRNNLVVHYDGAIYKCPAFIGHENLVAGHLETGLRDYRESHNMDVWKTDECLDCAYLPLCFGGCRFLKLLRGGAVNGVECRKAFYDAALEELVRQDLKYSLKK